MRAIPAFVALMLGALGACGACSHSDTLRSDGGSPPGAPDAGAGDGAIAPPPSPSLGATPHAGGVTFRVWAPHADAVFVAGDFNGWSATANPMAGDAHGVFSADVPGASVGQAYEFVVQHGADTLHRVDPRARALDNYQGHALIVDPNAFTWTNPDFAPPPVAQQVVYELHLGTFNPPAGATYGGTWASAMQKLDHLAALGVNMLEVMPPGEFPGAHSWGYNPILIDAAADVYGTPDDARRFIDAAHARGMGVIIDVVYNHLSSHTPLWCWDGDCLGAGGSYFYTDGRRNTPWGPRPDLGRAEVRDYLRHDALLWLTEYRADGLRWDSVVNLRNTDLGNNPDGWTLLRDSNDAVHALTPAKLQVAEDLQTADVVTQPTNLGGAGFDTQWDAAFFHPVDDTVITANDTDRSMPAIRDAITHVYNNTASQRVIYTEDHDEVANGKQRIPEMISPGDAGSLIARKRSTLGAAIALTSPGIPMLFMGQEFLENGFFSDTHPLDWTKTTTYAGILQLYTDLVHLRQNAAGATRGLTGAGVNVFHVNDGAKVIAYHRWQAGGAGDDVVVIANFADRAFTAYQIGLPRAGTWHVRFNSDSSAYSPDYDNTSSADVTTVAGTRDGYAQSGTLPLGKYGVVILSQ
ncbi:MAG TPA: alpha-amylase family glycosyl hydrolase [Polyangia bacterium]|nr:alpha-amylase family glycosyl hydrolase [Polyangia bacterium]